MAYIPNATDTAEPVESQTVESAALEFRTLKARVNTLDGTVASNLFILTAADTVLQQNINAETAARIADVNSEEAGRVNGDASLAASIAPYLNQVALVNFPNNFDLGFILDPVAPLNIFDFGSI